MAFKIFVVYLKKIFLTFTSIFTNISDIFYKIENIENKKYVLIIDEVEGINNEYFGTFLHAIRSVYHSRERHSLKSIILIGVSNITGIVQDKASPFNITDNLKMPYFTKDNKINFDKLINDYKQHIKLRSFRPYREKDDKGKFKSIPEAAMIYSFETYISIF